MRSMVLGVKRRKSVDCEFVLTRKFLIYF